MIQPTINTTTYGKPKSSGGGNGKTVINYNVNANTNTSGNINARSATINNILADYIKANKIDSTYGNVTYLISSDGTIGTLRGDTLTYGAGDIRNLSSDTITAHELSMQGPNDFANISSIFNNYLQSREITTDYLTVNKSFHAFEMIIDKIKSVGGTILNTATSCILDYVQTLDASKKVTTTPQNVKYYRCYWKATDDAGNETSNDWLEHDQAISQNCHLVSGQNHNAGNHYYWRVVDEVSQNTCYVNFNTGEGGPAVTTQPPYKITFSPIEGNNLFVYDNGGTDTGDEFSTLVHINNWDISSEITDDWNATNSELTIEDTAHGLQLIPPERVVIQGGGADGSDITEPYFISAGKFTFSTTKKAKLNFAVYFDDDTIEYHTYPSEINPDDLDNATGDYYYYDSENDRYIFNFEIIGGEAYAVKITITSDEVNIWHSCHWIDLSNYSGYYDEPTHLENTYDMDPQPNDNLVQLGYQYTELTSSELADLGYDSSRTDTAGQSLTTTYNNATDKQAWKDAHKDEVSRASAIIIAAFKTPDADVFPPSYAQYQNITAFDLSSARGTYMDATGGYFKGKLVSSSGTEIDIDDQLTVDVDYYGLICSESPVTKPSTGSKNINFSVLHVYNGVGTIMTNSELSNWYIIVNNGNEISASSGYFSYTVTSSTANSLDVKLYDPDDTMKDNIIVSAINLEDVTDGINGGYTDFVYHGSSSSLTAPTLPSNVNSSWDVMTTAQKAGWSKDTPTGYKYVWMTQRDNVGTQGGWTYGNWKTATRLTGEDGQPGTDGTDFEFIYTLSQISSTEVDNPAWAPNIIEPADHTIDDYTPVSWSYTLNGVTYIGDWEDHPQGVSSSYMYEYMAQRYSYTQNDTKYWSNFSTPVLWSKWGENGQDGDGIKYIFTKSITPLNAPSFGNQGWSDVWSSHLDTNNGTSSNRHMWYDDAFSPTDAVVIDNNGNTITNGDVLCSISKTYTVINGVTWWTDWSTPKTWAMYVQDGQDGNPGATGPQGETGAEGESWEVEILRGIFEVRINPSGGSSGQSNYVTKYEDITGDLYTDIIFALKHGIGDDVEYITNYSNYKVKLSTDNTYGTNTWTYTSSSTDSAISLVRITDTGAISSSATKYIQGFRFYVSNLLTKITSGDYTNYYYLHKNALTGRMPTKIYVTIMNSSDDSVIASTDIGLIFKPDHIFSVGETQLNSIYQGLAGVTGVAWTTGFSQIHQDWSNINLSVSNIQNEYDGKTLSDTNLAQYRYYKTASTTTPTKPTGNVDYSYNVPNTWTSYTVAPESSYMYVYITKRARTSYQGSSGIGYSAWSTWDDPYLYWKYGVDRSTVNSAQLDIKADQIQSTVSATYLSKTGAASTYATQTQLTQTATGISAAVKTDITGELQTTGIDITNGKIELNANNTVINGNLNIRAGLFYSDTYSVPNSIMASTTTRHTLRIDPTITDGRWKNTTTSGLYRLPPTTMYFFSGIPQGSSTSDRITNLELPAATDYDGLEISVFNLNTTSGYNVVYTQLRIKAASTDYLYAPIGGSNFFTTTVLTDSGRRYMLNQPYTGGSGQSGPYYMRQYPLQYTSGSQGDSLLLFPNVFYKFKAIAGDWYVIDGLFNGE